MTHVHDAAHRGHSSHLTSNTGSALEDRFEVLKDIGDGSFGSVVLARVRGAGSNIARRGTVVSNSKYQNTKIFVSDKFSTDCDQDNEEELRVFRPVSGASRSRLLEDAPSSRPPRSCIRYLPRSLQQEAPHLYGTYGWQSISTDESSGS